MQHDWFMYHLRSTYKNRLDFPFKRVEFYFCTLREYQCYKRLTMTFKIHCRLLSSRKDCCPFFKSTEYVKFNCLTTIHRLYLDLSIFRTLRDFRPFNHSKYIPRYIHVSSWPSLIYLVSLLIPLSWGETATKNFGIWLIDFAPSTKTWYEYECELFFSKLPHFYPIDKQDHSQIYRRSWIYENRVVPMLYEIDIGFQIKNLSKYANFICLAKTHRLPDLSDLAFWAWRNFRSVKANKCAILTIPYYLISLLIPSLLSGERQRRNLRQTYLYSLKIFASSTKTRVEYLKCCSSFQFDGFFSSTLAGSLPLLN